MSAIMDADAVEREAVRALRAMVCTVTHLTTADALECLTEAKYRLGQLILALESEVRAR